jgi:hypothetical protein
VILPILQATSHDVKKNFSWKKFFFKMKKHKIFMKKTQNFYEKSKFFLEKPEKPLKFQKIP